MKRRTVLIALFAMCSVVACVATLADTKIVSKEKILHQAQHLDPKVLDLGLTAYKCARQRGLDKKGILTIIDYSKPSTQKRLWVIDLNQNKVSFSEHVAHGQGSGDNYAKYFSDRNASHQSSLGVFLTKNTYFGHKGYSLRLAGLEKGYNAHALQRAIVMHGASYATPSFIAKVGRLGRSWGCPAISPKLVKPTINKIKNGTLVFAYYPKREWLQGSHFLHC